MADGTDFVLERELGHGSFGVVYLITSRTGDEKLALKTVDLSKVRAKDRDKEREDALKETILMKKIIHDHVVCHVASYFVGEVLFIYTEFCEGGDLEGFLDDSLDAGFLPEDLIVCWMAQAASALAYMHQGGFMHRDLKPENLYLTTEGHLKLGDLGLGRCLTGGRLAYKWKGTPPYMSPDIFREKGYGHKTDVWSLACVLYEIATFEKAFRCPVLQFLITLVLYGKIPSLPKHYSHDLNTLMRAMLERDTKQRLSSAAILTTPLISEFIERPRRPLDIIKSTKYKTNWGTHRSVQNLKRSKHAEIGPVSFDLRDIRISEDDLMLYRHRKRQQKTSPSQLMPIERDAVDSMAADFSKFNMLNDFENSTGNILHKFVLFLTKTVDKDGTFADVTDDPSPAFSADQPDAGLPKVEDTAAMVNQIKLLQGCVARELGQETITKAHKIMEDASDPKDLQDRLVDLLGSENFNNYGHSILYLRVFELGLES